MLIKLMTIMLISNNVNKCNKNNLILKIDSIYD